MKVTHLWREFKDLKQPMTERLKEAATQGLSTIDKLRMLLDITKKISRSLDLQEVLNLVMDTLDSLIPYDAAGIFVLPVLDPGLLPEGEEPCEFSSLKQSAATTSTNSPICT